jgi:hypothetical protein
MHEYKNKRFAKWAIRKCMKGKSEDDGGDGRDEFQIGNT